LATNELAADYSPELELLGTVSLAPAALFDRTYGDSDPIDPIVAHVVGVMAFYGAAAEHPAITPEEYVSTAGVEAARVLEDRCLDDIITSILSVPIDQFYDVHPLDVEPARSILLSNDVGSVRADSPLLLIGGTADERVVIARVRDLFDELCRVNQVTEYVELEGATHGDEYARSAEVVESWLAARLNGEAPTDSCEPPRVFRRLRHVSPASMAGVSWFP
ncbi:MAG: lipase family protein, partial [Phycisphaerales bacterium JB041]